MSQRLLFGCGYLGLRVARRWRDAGHEVHAVTRSAERAGQLARDERLQTIVADVTRPETLVGLPAAETVLYAVGFDRTSGRTMSEVYVDGLRSVLDALPPSTGRLIYISSTSVYAQGGGAWVDESSPTQPVRENGRVCLAAEEALRTHPLGARSITLRLSGIYGPGRVPRREMLAAGDAIEATADAYLNLIHVDDAATVVLAAEARSPLPSLYVVSDGQPVVRREYYEELARLAGAPRPRFVDPPAGAPAALRATTDKRVRNARMMAELQPTLAYPSYREGLAAILAASGA